MYVIHKSKTLYFSLVLQGYWELGHDIWTTWKINYSNGIFGFQKFEEWNNTVGTFWTFKWRIRITNQNHESESESKSESETKHESESRIRIRTPNQNQNPTNQNQSHESESESGDLWVPVMIRQPRVGHEYSRVVWPHSDYCFHYTNF